MAHLLMIESFLGGNAVILPALIRKLGHTYTFVTRSRKIYYDPYQNDIHPVIKHATQVIETNTNDVNSLTHILSGKSFDGVITTCDYYIEIVREVADKLDLPCPFPKLVENVRYKQKMRQALDVAGVANPKFCIANTWDEVLSATKKIGYPLVIKPVDLSSSAYVKKIMNNDELREAYDELEAFPINWRDQKRDCTYLLEEYMIGDEVSVEAVTIGGETTIIGITQKYLMGEPYFVESGHMFPANISEDNKEKISNYVISALQATGYDYGISHTEVKILNDGPKIVEINPRAAGDYIVELIKIVYNIDVLEIFINLSLSENINIEKSKTDIHSSCVLFITPDRDGKILNVDSSKTSKYASDILKLQIDDSKGREVKKPIDNTGRLGYVITKDNQGYESFSYAKYVSNCIIFTYE